MQPLKTLKYALLIAAGLAVVFACGVLWIALSHNPQGEFYGSELGVNWSGIIALWYIYFAVGLVTFAVLAWVIIKMVQILTKANCRAMK